MWKDFEGWNDEKQSIDRRPDAPFYHEREVWWCRPAIRLDRREPYRDGVRAPTQGACRPCAVPPPPGRPRNLAKVAGSIERCQLFIASDAGVDEGAHDWLRRACVEGPGQSGTPRLGSLLARFAKLRHGTGTDARPVNPVLHCVGLRPCSEVEDEIAGILVVRSEEIVARDHGDLRHAPSPGLRCVATSLSDQESITGT